MRIVESVLMASSMVWLLSCPMVSMGQLTFSKIVDTNTPIPGGIGNFTHVIGFSSAGPSFSNGKLAFDGSGSLGQRGIFTYIDGQLNVVADTNTPIPGLAGNFTDYDPPSLSGENLFFLGFGSEIDGNVENGLYTYVDGQLQTISDSNTLLEVSPRFALEAHTVNPVGISIPGRQGEFVGDRFIIKAENATRAPAAQTRIDMLAADTGPLQIVKESTIPSPTDVPPNNCADSANCVFDGFANSALGSASLSLQRIGQTEVLRVENISSSLRDGVAQLVPETMEMETELLTPNFSLSSPGATLLTTQSGIVDGEPDQLFSSMTIVNDGDLFRVAGDWDPIGATSYEVRVYNGNDFVTSQRGLPSGELFLSQNPDVSLLRCHVWIAWKHHLWIHSMVYSGDSPADITLPTVVFCGAESEEGQVRVYSRNGLGEINMVADEFTPIPNGTGNFKDFELFTAISDGIVAFSGIGSAEQRGLYTSVDGELSVIADTSTPIPGGTGTFTSFAELSMDGDDVAFTGYGSSEQKGIYLSTEDGELEVIADTNTPIPGGVGEFTNFGFYWGPSLSNGNVAFTGLGTDGQAGIYMQFEDSLIKVVDNGDLLDGKSFSDFAPYMSPQGLDGEQLAFEILFNDSSEAIFVATIPEPSSIWLIAFGCVVLMSCARRQTLR